ncbi:carbohydrate ABC transporter permease, partial [Enterocloster hominis (ex Hitch et al. 2024)]
MNRIKRLANQKNTAGYFFTLPFIIGFFMFLVVPMGMSLYYSFCDYNILSPPVFTGLENFKHMLRDVTFFKTLKVTFFFAFVSVPLKLLFALFVAMLLLKNSKLSGFYRAAYYLPSIIGGSVAVSVLWKRMFSSDGVINSLLQAVGVNCSVSWLGNTSTAIWVLILLVVWQFGSSMLIFLSALKQIPSSLYEAAMVDGSGPVYRFFKITLSEENIRF